jgi:hypothetical protein
MRDESVDKFATKRESYFLEFDSPFHWCYSFDKQLSGEKMLRNVPSVRSRIFSALFLVSILVRAQKIETVNGVRVVHNEKGGKWGANLEVNLELVRTIGGLDAEENLSFNNPNDIVRDSAGNLYIMDSGNKRIQKLDPERKFIRTIGRKGQGPGEIQGARSMDIYKLEILSPDGVFLGEIPITHHAHGIRIFGDNLFIREYYNTIFYQYKIIENEIH